MQQAGARFSIAVGDDVGAADVRTAKTQLLDGLRAWARPATLTVDAQQLSTAPFALLPQLVSLVLELRPLAQQYLARTTLLCTSPSWRTWVGRLTKLAPPSAPLDVVVLPRSTAARLGACVRARVLADAP